MAQLKVSNVTHKHGGEIFVELFNEEINFAAHNFLPDSSVFSLCLSRLISIVVSDLKEEHGNNIGVDFSDSSKYFAFVPRDPISYGENKFVRYLTEDEMNILRPMVSFWSDAQVRENPEISQ